MSEPWSNADAALIGFLAGRGSMPGEIAEAMRCSQPRVSAALDRWGVKRPDNRRAIVVPVTLTRTLHRLLAAKAKELSVEPREVLRRITECVLEEDLYWAVTDGRYD